MSVAHPRDMPETFGRMFNARDREGLLGLYAEDALLTVDGAAVARGRAEIAAMMAPMFDGPLTIATRCAACHQSGDTALVRTDWRLTAPGGAVAMAGSSAEVLRRGADGRWRFVLDDATFASRGPPAD